MSSGDSATAGLADLVRVPDYLATHSTVFPSDESFRWFLRQHRRELIEAGALMKPTGAWLIRSKVFDAKVAEIGQRRAARSQPGSFTP